MGNKNSYAFISYNHRDKRIARWLHKKLESYKLPTEIHNPFEDSRYLRPIFRDQDDLNTGVLSDELLKHLESSQYLVVICSPHSAKSEWVSNEVRTFIEWGRLEFIIPFIIDGTPNSQDENECLPLSLRQYVSVYPDRELLGISISEVGREKAFVRVVSRMLGVSFDQLWKRHERERKKRTLSWCIGTSLVASLIYYFAMPVTISIHIKDEKHHLPMPEKIMMVVNGVEYQLDKPDTVLSISDMPGYLRGRYLPLSVLATYYYPICQDIMVGLGVKQSVEITLKRDSTFAVFAGYIKDDTEMPIIKAEVSVDGINTQSDSLGYFRVELSIENQEATKALTIRKDGKKEISREDECPSSDLKYIMHNAAEISK